MRESERDIVFAAQPKIAIPLIQDVKKTFDHINLDKLQVKESDDEHFGIGREHGSSMLMLKTLASKSLNSIFYSEKALCACEKETPK